ncbi:MAG: leucyl/phenylalanyl-tRNA--protein transferase [Gammaproteobacteria bacterium]|nr:leucyl/phenylalanyl-tRNA--protein transferase [Gammaproteobacteria bacterium]
MSGELHWLDPADPPDSFPDPRLALSEPDGLLAVGGDLAPERLLAAYRRGIFPWYQDDQPILWWSPNPRAVLFPAEMRISRSLRRTLRRNTFDVSVNQDFAGVIAGCAAERDQTGTWITEDMLQAYTTLHRSGHAHSIETWHDGKLVGGLYGVSIGGVFFGESMFARATDASKVALTQLTAMRRDMGIELIDCQVASAHLASLGARQISRTDFQAQLRRLTVYPAPQNWTRPAAGTRDLCEFDA